MREARFEEKEYESALYRQLIQTGDLWPPGTVLEQHLGFDLSALLYRDFLWDLHGIPPQVGISIYDDVWPILRRKQFPRERLPTGRFNCFIQAKRAEPVKRPPAPVVQYGVSAPCYRFLTDPVQQQCLEFIANAFRDRALFVYAAPVFHTSEDYHRHRTLGDIVEHSTFPQALHLAGHNAWYFREPGVKGVRNPDYSPHESASLLEEIARLRQSAQGERGSLDENLPSLSQKLFNLVREAPEIASTPRAAAFAEEWRGWEGVKGDTNAPNQIVSYLQIRAFSRAYNLTWTIIKDTHRA